MFKNLGRSIRLSMPRKLVCDLVHFAHKIPTVPVQRDVKVGEVEDLRSRLSSRPGWCAIFTKAYARVAALMPELRRAYLSFPWARLYEHPINVASIAVERDYYGEKGVFFARLESPDLMGLMELHAALEQHKAEPIESLPSFRTALRICRLPRFMRRIAWWYVTAARGYRKALWLGTFGVSVYSSLGAESLHPLSPLTTTLNYGVIQDGIATVRLIYDHRVLDGATVARALARLEEILNTEIVSELAALPCKAASSSEPAASRSGAGTAC